MLELSTVVNHDCKILELSWLSIESAVNHLWVQIRPQMSKDTEVTLAPVIRGGLLPAVILSHLMGEEGYRSLVAPIRPDDSGIELLKELPDPIIVVEDIIDTGETIRVLKNSDRPFQTCTVIGKKVPDLDFYQGLSYEAIIEKDDPRYWVVFPWEKSKEPDREFGL